MIEFIDDLGNFSAEWQWLMESSAYASFFQSRQCLDFYVSLSCFDGFAYGVADNGELLAVIVGYVTVDKNPLVQYFTRRAIIQAGPLLSERITPEALELLLKGTIECLKSRAIYVEIRNYFDFSAYKTIMAKAGFVYVPHLNFRNDTSSQEIVDARLSKNIKRGVKSSLGMGATVVENPDYRQLKEFYSILKQLYKNKIHTPLFPWEFFSNLFDNSFSKWFLVELKGKIIGGMVCVVSCDRLYEWFVCGEDNVYKGVHPSKLATYSALCYCARKGYKFFDMMGAGKPGDDYGVRDFKSRFGGTLVEEGRFVHIAHPLLYKIGKWGVKLLKKI